MPPNNQTTRSKADHPEGLEKINSWKEEVHGDPLMLEEGPLVPKQEPKLPSTTSFREEPPDRSHQKMGNQREEGEGREW